MSTNMFGMDVRDENAFQLERGRTNFFKFLLASQFKKTQKKPP